MANMLGNYLLKHFYKYGIYQFFVFLFLCSSLYIELQISVTIFLKKRLLKSKIMILYKIKNK